MNTQTLSTVTIAIIVVWAIWAVFSRRVRDGIIGKVIYAAVALSGYAIVTRSETFFLSPTVAGVTFHASLAMAGARHIFMVTWWPSVKRWLCSKLSCGQCLHANPGKRAKEGGHEQNH